MESKPHLSSESMIQQGKKEAELLRGGSVEFNHALLTGNFSRNNRAIMLSRVLTEALDVKRALVNRNMTSEGKLPSHPADPFGTDLDSERGVNELIIREVLDKQDEVGSHSGFANGIQTAINKLDLSDEQIDKLRSVYGITIERNELFDGENTPQEEKWIVDSTSA